MKPTKEQIESVFRLLEACRRCGATFRTGLTTNIKLPDGIKLRVEEKGTMWQIGGWSIPKNAKVKTLQLFIMEQHAKILRENG